MHYLNIFIRYLVNYIESSAAYKVLIFYYFSGLLLDICLPFTAAVGLKNIQHCARFLLMNYRILGIRIKTGQLWNRYHIE
jgi:hypothetical protein